MTMIQVLLIECRMKCNQIHNTDYNTVNRQSHYISSQISSIRFAITIFEKKFRTNIFFKKLSLQLSINKCKFFPALNR